MPSTDDILARLAQWRASTRVAHALTHEHFTKDLAALVDAVAVKDRAIDDLISAGSAGQRSPSTGWRSVTGRTWPGGSGPRTWSATSAPRPARGFLRPSHPPRARG
jgi:hypothetical protein